MLAAILHRRRTAPEGRDTRSVDEVLSAAYTQLHLPRADAIANELHAHGVQYAWQMEQMSDTDWQEVGVPLGLKTAAKAEIAYPTIATASAAVNVAATNNARSRADDNNYGEYEMDERLRRFLLLPTTDGQEARPLLQASAAVLGLITMPPSERQQLLLILCELMALISGLYLPLALELRRGLSDATPSTEKGWDVAPTVADGMDALAILTLMVCAWINICSVGSALMIAMGGFHADSRFCQGAGALIAVLYFTFCFLVGMPTILLVCWQTFTIGASPYPLIGTLVLNTVIQNGTGNFFWRLALESLSLEVYHMPRWFLGIGKQQAPWLRHLMDEKALKAAAERRAAKLRSRVIDVGDIPGDVEEARMPMALALPLPITSALA